MSAPPTVDGEGFAGDPRRLGGREKGDRARDVLGLAQSEEDGLVARGVDVLVGDTIDGFTYPLQGDVDWTAVSDALEELGYDGWVTAEVPPYETGGDRMPEQVLENVRSVL